MAFSSLPNALIAVGKPIIKLIFQTLKDNQDDVNTRLALVEGAAGKVVVWDNLVLNGTSLATADYLADFRAPFNFTLIEARVSIFEKGLSTGTIEMDVRKGATADVDLSTSIFTTQPSILLSGASDFDESSNAVFDAGQKDVLEGEYLFLDMSQLPATENMKTWRVYLIGEAS